MISIVIPSYNSEATIGKCLDSLLRQTYRGSRDITVVDSSRDRTPEIVAEKYPDVALVHLGEKTDPGTARNIGIGKTRGEVIAFLDSDCVAAADWLERILAAHELPYNVVGGAVRNGNEPDDPVAWAGYFAEFREFIPERGRRETGHIPTCNISYKRKIFEEHGLFQGRYYPQEDLVYNHALSTRGEKILFDPAIQVHHHHRTGWKDFLAHQRRIGKVTARVLKEIDLEGSFLPRHPLLAGGLLPFLPAVKFLRTLAVFLRHQPGTVLRHPGAALLFGVGLANWGLGFAEGVYGKREVGDHCGR